jgi:hypothetical protein
LNVLLPNFESSNLLAGSVVGVDELEGVELTVPPPPPHADIKTKSTIILRIFITYSSNITVLKELKELKELFCLCVKNWVKHLTHFSARFNTVATVLKCVKN